MGDFEQETARRLRDIDNRLADLERRAYGYIFVPVTPLALTDTGAQAWNGTATGALNTTYTFDLTDANNAQPANIKAAVLEVEGLWGAAADGSFAQARQNFSTNPAFRIFGQVASIRAANQGIVTVDSDGTLDLEIVAHTMTEGLLRLVGYFI